MVVNGVGITTGGARGPLETAWGAAEADEAGADEAEIDAIGAGEADEPGATGQAD